MQRPQATVELRWFLPILFQTLSKDPKAGKTPHQAAGEHEPPWGELYSGTGWPHATQMGAVGTTTALKTCWVLERGRAHPWAVPAWWF